MGLDSFKSDDSSWGSGGGSNGKTGGNKDVNTDNSHTAYRIIWNGEQTIPIEDNEVVIQTEEEWNKIEEFINKSMDISTDEFESMSKKRKYSIVKNAVDTINKHERGEVAEEKDCMVCGETFRFPGNWNFIEFDDFLCCPNHTVEEVMEQYEDHMSIV